MNQKKAKALRRGLGYHPADKREYESVATSRRVPAGTILSNGLRRQYQSVKRNPALAAAVTGAR